MAGWARPSSGLAVTTNEKNIVWLNKNQRVTDVQLVGGRGASLPGPNLGYGGCCPKAIDRSKDLNVCTFQYVDNGLSLSR